MTLSLNRDLAITYLADHVSLFSRNPMVMVYANTLKDHFVGDRVMLTHKMDPEMRDIFSRMGYLVVDVPPIPEKSTLFAHRWKSLHDFLCTHGSHYRYVMFTDSKDVLWQRDPISDIKAVCPTEDWVVLCHEGVTHSECHWNTAEQSCLWSIARTSNYDFSNWPVINGGVVIGGLAGMRELAFLMQMITMVGNTPTTDQCYINFLYQQRQNTPGCKYILADPFYYPFTATGNTIKFANSNQTTYRWHNGQLIDRRGRPFALYHQWDRTKHRGEILTTHGAPRME